MRKVLLLAAVGVGLLVSACNTIQGVGRDLEAAGEAVSDAASRR